jgi:hypothetical protein
MVWLSTVGGGGGAKVKDYWAGGHCEATTKAWQEEMIKMTETSNTGRKKEEDIPSDRRQHATKFWKKFVQIAGRASIYFLLLIRQKGAPDKS